MQAIRRSWRTWCTFLSISLVLVAALALLFPPRGVGHDGPDEEHAAIPQPQNVIELHLTLGLTDEVQSFWEGDVQVSEGKLIKLEIIQASRDSTVDGNKFRVRAAQSAAKKAAQKKANQDAKQQADPKAKKDVDQQAKQKAKQKKKKKQKQLQQAAAAGDLVPARLRAILDAPASAKITVNTSKGSFSFALAELMLGSEQTFLDSQASVRRQAGALPLTGTKTEDDYPVFARGKDGTLWLAYIAFQPGPELVTERVLAGNFEALESHSGEQIRLLRFDGKNWQQMPPVTENGMEFWRPTIAVDDEGAVHVAWAQKLNDDWNILARRFQPAKEKPGTGKWNEIQVVTDAKGSDFHVVATTDAKGKVWLAWQGWRGDNYDIMLTSTHPTAGWDEPQRISQSKSNDWSPTIAADSKGQVYVAWDTYDKENYDVVLHQVGEKTSALIQVANSAQFEARPNLYCDAQDRVWIAYEEGNEQWGKDYASDNGYRNVGLSGNPGFALYVDRTVKVRCFDKGTLFQPAGELTAAFSQQLTRNKSLPRLMGDQAGGLWLLVRHHPLPGGAGEVWHSYAMRYSGNQWSEPKQIPSSSNLLDNRPALAPFDKGILVVQSSDSRMNTASRGQSDLYAISFSDEANAAPPELVRVAANSPAKLTSVHENESEVVKKLRELRLSVGGKNLHLIRGEFHRHTEFTAHRDQDGLLEDSWRYALDAGKLDWMGNGDHDNGGHEYMWWIIQKQCDLHHNPPHFVAAMTYERSTQYPNGHRNVMMPRRGIRPLPRGQLQGTPEEGTPDTKVLYAYLKHFGGICASHTSATNMGTDWRDNDPEVEPVVEIYQGHRHNYEHFGAPRAPTAETNIGGYQPAGFIWNALEKGYKLGFQSSSDHVSTHMSYAGVFATENSRKAIIDAFKQRHCFGATDNILLVVRSGEQMMGDIFTTKENPKISIQAVGGKPLAKVSIVRDNKYVYANEPMTLEVRREYTDMDVKPGETHYYYVRAEQSDGNLAWASPMWITYQP